MIGLHKKLIVFDEVLMHNKYFLNMIRTATIENIDKITIVANGDSMQNKRLILGVIMYLMKNGTGLLVHRTSLLIMLF